MSSRSNTTSLSTAVVLLVVLLVRQSTGTSSSFELISRTEKRCPWDWMHVGNICLTTAPSGLRALGGSDVVAFCGRRGAYVLTVDGYDLCVKYTKIASNALPERPPSALLDFVGPASKRVMGNVGF